MCVFVLAFSFGLVVRLSRSRLRRARRGVCPSVCPSSASRVRGAGLVSCRFVVGRSGRLALLVLGPLALWSWCLGLGLVGLPWTSSLNM